MWGGWGEGQGLLGGRSFPFGGVVGDESSKPSTPMNRSSDTVGEDGESLGSGERGKVLTPLARDLVLNLALL